MRVAREFAVSQDNVTKVQGDEIFISPRLNNSAYQVTVKSTQEKLENFYDAR